jgi:hypothetical protein
MLSAAALPSRAPSEPPKAVVAASHAALPAASFRRSGRGFSIDPGEVPPESE